jgi:capsular exopolysaccharide synthesis family protein
MLFSNAAAPQLDRRLVSFVNATSFEAEQYRRLRQQIERLAVTRGLRTLAITSAVASDGKTLTAINLAGALAQAKGARILLIDADLRRPAVAQHLGIDAGASAGLMAAVQAPRGRLSDDVVRVGDSSLWVLPCGQSRADTYELLASPRLVELLGEARRQYDYVLIDTPPIVPVPDGVLLSRAVDGYLLVISAHTTPRKLVAEALNLLEPTSVVGLVFNRDDRPLFGYYRSRYRHYFRSYVQSLNKTA